jgi:FkbM family methyltransferase
VNRSSVAYRTARVAVHAARDVGDRIEGLYRRRTGRLLTVSAGPYRLRIPEDMRWAFKGGVYYERALAHWLERLMSKAEHKVFFDIGANYGYFTLLLAPHAEAVHAFEPVTATHTRLLATLAENAVPNATVHPLALSDHEGDAEIRLFTSSGNNSLFDVDVGADVRGAGTETVRLDTLDRQVYELGLPAPGLIKIDVEGAELHVLRGGSRVLREHRPPIAMEFYPRHFEKAGYTSADVAAELRDVGYELYEIPDRVGDELRPLEGVPVVPNIVALAAGGA